MEFFIEGNYPMLTSKISRPGQGNATINAYIKSSCKDRTICTFKGIGN